MIGILMSGRCRAGWPLAMAALLVLAGLVGLGCTDRRMAPDEAVSPSADGEPRANVKESPLWVRECNELLAELWQTQRELLEYEEEMWNAPEDKRGGYNFILGALAHSAKRRLWWLWVSSGRFPTGVMQREGVTATTLADTLRAYGEHIDKNKGTSPTQVHLEGLREAIELVKTETHWSPAIDYIRTVVWFGRLEVGTAHWGVQQATKAERKYMHRALLRWLRLYEEDLEWHERFFIQRDAGSFSLRPLRGVMRIWRRRPPVAENAKK